MGTLTRDARTSAVVEALVLEGVLGTGRAALAADVIDRVLAADAPPARKSVLPEVLTYVGLFISLVGGQLAIFDESTDVIGYTLLALVAVGGNLAYIARPILAFLLISVVATTLVIPQLVRDLTDGILGSDGSWLMGGMAFFSSVLIAWRLHEEHGR